MKIIKNSDTTIKDIARLCNTSFSTVSSILRPGKSNTRFSEKTRKKVTETAGKLGYRPNRVARALISGKPSLIAISLHDQPYRCDDNFYFFDILKNASDFLMEKDFETLLLPFTSHNEQIERLKRLKDEVMIAGVISNFIPGKDKLLTSALENMNLPFTILGKAKSGPCVISISNVEKYISDYAEEKKCTEAFIVKHDPMSPSARLEFESITNPGRSAGIKEIRSLKDKVLLALYGNTVFTTLISEYPGCSAKLLLVEDERRIPIMKPALLVHSVNKERIKMAVEMLMYWIEKGIPPEDNQKCVSLDEISFVN